MSCLVTFHVHGQSNRNAAYKYLEAQDFEKASTLCSLYLSTTQDSTIKRIDAKILLGRISDEMGNSGAALTAYDNARQLCEILGDSIRLPYVYHYRGLTHYRLGNMSLALKDLIQAELLHDGNDGIAHSTILNSLGSIQRSLKNHKLSLSYYKQALSIYTTLESDKGISQVYNNLGLLFLALNQIDTAKALFQKNLHFQANNPTKKSITLLNLGELYMNIKETDSALYYYRKSYRIKKEISDLSGLAILCNNLAKAEMAGNNFAQAEEYLLEARQISYDIGMLEEQVENNRLYSLFYERTNLPTEALKSYKSYTALKDSLLNQEKVRALTEMQIRYETEEKEGELKAANYETEVQRKIVTSQTIALWSVGGLALLILIVGFLIYRLYLASKKEKELINWRMREQHHRIENNISVLASILSLAAQNTDNEEAKTLARDGENRLNAMNLLHKQLYGEEDRVAVQLDAFIQDLSKYLQSVFLAIDSKVLTVNTEKISVDVSQAIPMCLILNELMTNAFKYGLNNMAPKLEVSLSKESDYVKIMVSDNGSGFSETASSQNSFGLRLIDTLVKQIKGTLSCESNDSGTSFELHIPRTDQRL